MDKNTINENLKVLDFIDTWQKGHEYSSIKLEDYNTRFKNDFDLFLSTNNFTDKTKQLFIIKN